LDRVAGAWPTSEPFVPRDVIEVFGDPGDDVTQLSLA
jgi:hypothetical protein